MKITLYSHAYKTHFHRKWFALCLALKVRVMRQTKIDNEIMTQDHMEKSDDYKKW